MVVAALPPHIGSAIAITIYEMSPPHPAPMKTERLKCHAVIAPTQLCQRRFRYCDASKIRSAPRAPMVKFFWIQTRRVSTLYMMLLHTYHTLSAIRGSLATTIVGTSRERVPYYFPLSIPPPHPPHERRKKHNPSPSHHQPWPTPSAPPSRSRSCSRTSTRRSRPSSTRIVSAG